MVADAGHTIPGLRLLRLPVRPAWLAVIGVGGTIGTGARAWLEAAYAAPAGGWPWVTFWINVGGSFLLGVLLEVLAETGRDVGWRRGLRLGLGTGLLGGFTTYSTFSVETVELFGAGALPIALGYAVGSVVTGLLAALTGTWAVRLLLGRLRGEPS